MQQGPEILGKILYFGDLNLVTNQAELKLKLEGKLDTGDRRVLIIHTGGTIGMFSSFNGYRTEKHRFTEFLKKYPYFCDTAFTEEYGQDQFIITPPSIYGKRVWFKLQELDSLIDSSNMNLQYWNILLGVLESVYKDYDAFIVLHGTDSMCYTASMLSFMIQNLNKTIVLTGAQIPISQTRNDSINNLLCSIFVAGHFKIPEILIVFDDLLLRGNRSKKVCTTSIASMDSPNFPPLAKFGLTFDIQWDNIVSVEKQAEVKFIKFREEITTVKLTPYTVTIPTAKYVIIESYGCGNFPNEGPIAEWLIRNSELPQDQKQIILNISQVETSCVIATYQAGSSAKRLGILVGTDMTIECACAKLMYLATKGYSLAQISEKVTQCMRGELTESTEGEEAVITSLWNQFQNKTKEQRKLLLDVVLPRIAIQKEFNLPLIDKLVEYGFKPSTTDYHKRNLLHLICMYPSYDRQQSVWLLKKLKVDINAVDDQGNSPLFYAIINRY